MISRRRVLGLAAFAALFPALVRAQKEATPRIGILGIKSAVLPKYMDAFREGLRGAGYTVGRNIRIEDRFLAESYDKFPDAAARLLAEKVDIVLSFGATGTLAVSKQTPSVPIVFIVGTDPVKMDLVQSLSRPGRNATGIVTVVQDLSGKRLELLLLASPGIRRIGLVINPESATSGMGVEASEAAARRLKIELRTLPIHNPGEIDDLSMNAARMKVDALVVGASSMLVAERQRVVDSIGKSRLPAIYSIDDYVGAGGLMCYGPNYSAAFRRAAGHVAGILKGAKPAEMPVEQASEFELVLNLRTARAQGISLPSELIARADRVIQ